jgi:hypothetical protein
VKPAAGLVSTRALAFYKSLKSPTVPRGVHVMNPYGERRVQEYMRSFLRKYFHDSGQRVLILGINPGRFGAGITGVTFTDPVALADDCGIPNDFQRRRELSSVFVYDVIARLGGPAAFYNRFFLSAVCPLGFTREGINLNYYDDRKLEKAVTPFIVESIETHLGFGGRRDHVVVLGRGDNAKFLRRLNEQHGWFDNIHALDHPRFILQYRRKKVDHYLTHYEETLLNTSK